MGIFENIFNIGPKFATNEELVEIAQQIHKNTRSAAIIAYDKKQEIMRLLRECETFYKKSPDQYLNLGDIDADLKDLQRQGVITQDQLFDYREEFGARILEVISEQVSDRGIRLEPKIDHRTGRIQIYAKASSFPEFLEEMKNGKSVDFELLNDFVNYYHLPIVVSRIVNDAPANAAPYISDLNYIRVLAVNPEEAEYNPYLNDMQQRKAICHRMKKKEMVAAVETSEKLIIDLTGHTEEVVNEFAQTLKLMNNIFDHVSDYINKTYDKEWPSFLESKGIDFDEYL